jgi:cysteinyl-tRNA synthetase
MHNEHIDFGGAKMAKSGDNFITLRTVIDKGINPISYRFWLLMGHYRTKMNFNWDALLGAETALKRLYGLYLELGNEVGLPLRGEATGGHVHKEYQNKFKEYMGDDLDTPRALSLLWDVFKDKNISDGDKKATILYFDKVLGLGFEQVEEKAKKETIPEEVIKLAEERRQARVNKDFKKSDELRNKINSLGYEIKDTPLGEKISKI